MLLSGIFIFMLTIFNLNNIYYFNCYIFPAEKLEENMRELSALREKFGKLYSDLGLDLPYAADDYPADMYHTELFDELFYQQRERVKQLKFTLERSQLSFNCFDGSFIVRTPIVPKLQPHLKIVMDKFVARLKSLWTEEIEP